MENNPNYIDASLLMGLDCEIDLWVDESGNLGLGHDEIVFPVSRRWLIERSSKLWIHCKNINALTWCANQDPRFGLNYFWHESDKFTLTSQNYIWTYPGEAAPPIRGVVVCTSQEQSDFYRTKHPELFGICSDFLVDPNG